MFENFKRAIQRQFNDMKDHELYTVKVEKDLMWDTYLSSFPDGTNPLFRERTEHDCNCCKQFIRTAGAIVAIIDDKLVSIWDVKVDSFYQEVADALSDLVKSKPIKNVFFHTEHTVGTDKSYEPGYTWEHFYIQLPTDVVGQESNDIPTTKEMLLRACLELEPAALDMALDLIAQGSLYRGEEHREAIVAFKALQQGFINTKKKELFCWRNIYSPVARIRNTVIGTLLQDLSDSTIPLERAVASFETKVAPTNYKRPTALVTQAMVDNAKQTIEQLGLTSALERRYAVLEDIKVNNVLFVDRSVRAKLGGDVFDQVPVKTDLKFDRLGEVSIDCFIDKILPNVDSVEIFVENKHFSNLVSLIAPSDLTAKSMFKWPNAFSWSYTGELTDSIKARVKQAGGVVDADLRCSLAWFNTDDLDLHMIEPDKHQIFFRNKGRLSRCGGMLDVDMNVGMPVTNAVENIFYKDKKTMQEGIYELRVNNYYRRSGVDSGFEIEVEFDGVVHTFVHKKAMREGDTVIAAKIKYSKESGFSIIDSLPSTQAAKTEWNIQSQAFHKVNVCMLSPNYWDDNKLGNRHFFFMLDNCINPGQARGFFNEFLTSGLDPHRKVLEMVGARIKTAEAKDQLSGIGFSSTQRNSVVCRVKGSFTRDIKIMF